MSSTPTHRISGNDNPIPGPAVAPASSPEPKSARARWLGLVVLLAAAFMDLLDTTIVNVAIPSIRSNLDAGYAALQWVVAAYLLAVAVGLITFGRLGDRYGRRRLFLIGVVGFGCSSLCCGLAPTAALLITSRAAQGVFAAAMMPQILSTIHVSFGSTERPRALALYSTVSGLAVMSGPLVGGVLLSELHLSWRYIFLINVPVSVAVVVGTILLVAESRSDDARPPDFVGAALVSSALLALVFSLIQGRESHWPLWIFGLMLVSVALVAVFAWYEKRKEQRGESPLIPIGLFRRRAVPVGLLAVVVLYSGIVGFWLAFTVFLQIGLGYTPIQAALTTVPSSIGLIIAAGLSGKLASRPGPVVLAGGALVMATAMVGFILVLGRYGGSITAWQLRPIVLMLGFGMGLTIPTLADAIMSHIPEREAGAASGLINSGLQVGNALGVAVIGAILFSALGTHAPTSARIEAANLSRQLEAQGVPAQQRQAVTDGFVVCFSDAAREEDPAALPASCRRSGELTDPRMKSEVVSALERARKDDFSVAIAHAIRYAVAAFVLAAVLLACLGSQAGLLKRLRARIGGSAAEAAIPAPTTQEDPQTQTLKTHARNGVSEAPAAILAPAPQPPAPAPQAPTPTPTPTPTPQQSVMQAAGNMTVPFVKPAVTARRIEVVPGRHLVANVNGTVIAVAHRGPAPLSPQSVAARHLSALVEIVRTTEGQRRVNAFWQLTKGNRAVVDFGVVTATATGSGFDVFLRGAVTVVLDHGVGRTVLTGAAAPFGLHQSVPVPAVAAIVTVDEAGEGSPALAQRSGVYTLSEGTVPGQGAVIWSARAGFATAPPPAVAAPAAPPPAVAAPVDRQPLSTAKTVQTGRSLGCIILDDNSRFETDRDCVIGRAPHDSDAVQRGFRPVRVEDPTGDISRAHAEIRRVNGEVLVVDRGSTNGVFLREPAQQAWTRLAPWRPTVWLPGAAVRIGKRILRLQAPVTQELPLGAAAIRLAEATRPDKPGHEAARRAAAEAEAAQRRTDAAAVRAPRQSNRAPGESLIEPRDKSRMGDGDDRPTTEITRDPSRSDVKPSGDSG